MVQIESAKYVLVDIEKPKGNFIQLESFTKDKNYSRVIHMLLPDSKKTSFKLGRGHDADLKISDISVSRVHAEILLTENGYLLQDHAAKFGTLALLPPKMSEIDPINGLSLQINRTALSLSVKTNCVITIPGASAVVPILSENAASPAFNLYHGRS